MDEDLDQLVERVAAMLTSAKAEEVVKGAFLLEEVFSSAGRDTFSRLAQELAAYQGGAILEQLLTGALVKLEPQENDELFVARMNQCMVSCLAVATLSASKVVVDRYFDGRWETAKGHSAYEVYLRLSGNLLTRAHNIERGLVHLNPFAKTMVLNPLECLANFARQSKIFRQAMKDASEELNLFDQLGFLVSAGLHRKLSPENSQRVRVLIAEVASSLVLSPDSVLWALDRGVLKLVAAVYAVSPGDWRQDSFRRDRAPTFQCNVVLLRLLCTESAAERLRAHNALDGFRPHTRKINDAAWPGLDFWVYLKGMLQGRKVRVIDPRNGQPCRLEVKANGTESPVVCSWKQCTAGPEPVGNPYKRCAGCQVARYCSKEHQKLHWPTHKIHCRADRGNQGRHASAPAGGESSESSS